MAAFVPRYANALADVVFDRKLDPAQVQQQLDDFAATFAASRDLREALLNPVLPAGKRVAILDAVLDAVVDGVARRSQPDLSIRNFLAVLIDHGRLGALDEILKQYRLEMNRRQGVSEAEVTTAHKLEESERAEVERQVAGLTGALVRASYREDKSLIGGAIVRVGSTVYDGSVKGRLERLRERLVAG
jgi:F-type H+-transporting ATPase subunit delta